MISIVTVNAAAVAESMAYVILGTAVLYFAYIFTLGRLTREEKKRVGVIVVLFMFSWIFWAAFEQAPTSLNLFARDFTDRMVGGFEVPASWFQSINSGFIVLLSPLFAALWMTLGRRGRDFSSPAKFSLGLFLAGVGFLIMLWAANEVVREPGTLVSPWWLVGSYFFQTLGEMFLTPVGLATMTALAPRKYLGHMMGIWFMSISLGNLIAGLAGGHVDPSKLEQMPKLFTMTTVFLMAAALVLALLIVPIRRMLGTTKVTAA